MEFKKQFVIMGAAVLLVFLLIDIFGKEPSHKYSIQRMESRITILEDRVLMLEKKIINLDQAVMHPEVKILPAK